MMNSPQFYNIIYIYRKNMCVKRKCAIYLQLKIILIKIQYARELQFNFNCDRFDIFLLYEANVKVEVVRSHFIYIYI